MNNPNPFVPKGSLLEQQSQRRFRLKFAVGCVLAVSITGLVTVLIQGCHRTPSESELNPQPLVDTNTIPVDTNPPPYSVSNPPVTLPPLLPPTNNSVVLPPTPPPTAEVGGSEYVVVKGDSLAKIAKKNGVPTKALQAANPTVVPTKLKIGQKLVIPAGGKTSAGGVAPVTTTAGGVAETAGETYTVKSGDTLTKIAKAHGTTPKAIQAANGLSTTKIKVGQKLKLPSKAEAAPVAPVAPVVTPDTAPALPPPSTIPAAPTAPTSR